MDNIYLYILYIPYLKIPKPYKDVSVCLISITPLSGIVAQSADCVVELTDVTTSIKDLIEGTDVRVAINVQSEFMTDRIEQIDDKTVVVQNPNSLTTEEQEDLLANVAQGEETKNRLDELLEEARPYMESEDPEHVEYQRDMMDIKDQIPDCKAEYDEALRNRNNDNN